MKHMKIFARLFGLASILLLLVACGGGSGANLPEAGDTFFGVLALDTPGSNATAGGGEIEFTIADDGASIGTLTYSISDIECANATRSIVMTSGGRSSTITLVQPVSISSGSFEFDIGDIAVSGEFTSSTEAEGSFAMTTNEDAGMGNRLTCDFGTWTWAATLK